MGEGLKRAFKAARETRKEPSMTTKGPTHAEKVADAVLQAAGSGFKYYTPDTKVRIIEAAAQALEQQSDTSGLREALRIHPMTEDGGVRRGQVLVDGMAEHLVLSDEYSNDIGWVSLSAVAKAAHELAANPEESVGK